VKIIEKVEIMKNEIKDLTNNFSVDKLNFSKGSISKSKDDEFYNITIPIKKFILDDEIIETELNLSRIIFNKPFASYIRKKISFPINPTSGYIDGSIYLRDSHNPVDVSQIKFILFEDDVLVIELTMDFIFEFEGIGFKNENLVAQIVLQIV
jgi:hypothetical protein